MSGELCAVLFHRAASPWGSRDGLTETGSEELVVGSTRIWAEVGGWLNAAWDGRWDEGLGGALDVGRAGVSEGVSEELDVDVYRLDRLVGVSEGESESVCGRGSDGESVGELVRGCRGTCAGVGSCGSVQTGSPSATYHTSLCLFRSFKGLHTKTHTQGKSEKNLGDDKGTSRIH